MTFLGWLSDPFKRLSDLQLGDEKGTLNHLVYRGSLTWRIIPVTKYLVTSISRPFGRQTARSLGDNYDHHRSETTETSPGMFLQEKRLTKMTKSWKQLDKYVHVEFVVFLWAHKTFLYRLPLQTKCC